MSSVVHNEDDMGVYIDEMFEIINITDNKLELLNFIRVL
jgi:hypothetical protein